MKTPAPRTRRSRPRGFTLMELIVVIAIMGVLATMVLAVTTFVQTKARSSKAQSQMQAMELGLERYKQDWGRYPRPAGNPTKDFDGVAYDTGGAQMLYQALSGDGSSMIRGAEGTASNGQLGEPSDGPLYCDILSPEDRSQNMVLEEDGEFMLVDPFGKPWQYEAFHPKENPSTNNETFDLWSYGLWDGTDGRSEHDPEVQQEFIKNW